jgi:hypothetical protein
MLLSSLAIKPKGRFRGPWFMRIQAVACSCLSVTFTKKRLFCCLRIMASSKESTAARSWGAICETASNLSLRSLLGIALALLEDQPIGGHVEGQSDLLERFYKEGLTLINLNAVQLSGMFAATAVASAGGQC